MWRFIDLSGIGHSLFPLGQGILTDKAFEALDKADDNYWNYVERHCSGDWGEIGSYYDVRLINEGLGENFSDDGKKANLWILERHQNGAILSTYSLKDNTKIWIITDCRFDQDKNLTTIFLPSEY